MNLDYIVFSCCRRISHVLFRRRIFVASWCAMNFWFVFCLRLSARMFLVWWPWWQWKGLPMGWAVCDVHLPFVFFEALDSRLWRNEVGYFCCSGVLNLGGNELTVRWCWTWPLLYYLVLAFGCVRLLIHHIVQSLVMSRSGRRVIQLLICKLEKGWVSGSSAYLSS
jgi:hypothetical protein